MYTPLLWRQADHDVHVATLDGEFAGFVVADGDVHTLHDALGATERAGLGRFTFHNREYLAAVRPLDGILGYFLGTTLRLGVARGFGEEGITDFYLLVGAPF